MSDFDGLFDKSCVPKVLKVNRTLSKEECRGIFKYMSDRKPKLMFEFGVQNGCSTKAFVEMAKWADLDFELHSWDVVDVVKCLGKDEFNFHMEDVTGKEEEIFDKYNPDFVFLDAHPYGMTKKIMEICLERKIDFMTHDVHAPFMDLIRKRSNYKNEEGLPDGVNTNVDAGPKGTVPWELYLLGKLIDESIWTDDHYENDVLEVNCIRDNCGVAIIKFKK